MKNKIIFWLASLPLLEFYLRLPFIEISTILMSYSCEQRVIDYTRFHVRIWKYQLRFGLFDTFKKLRNS